MNTETITLPDLRSYATMDIDSLWTEYKRLGARLYNGEIDEATHDEHSQVLKLALAIRADELDIAAAQHRLVENHQRLDALLPTPISAEALAHLRYIADQESRDDPAYGISFSGKQLGIIDNELLAPGYVEIVDGPADPADDPWDWFYIATPLGLAFFKDK